MFIAALAILFGCVRLGLGAYQTVAPPAHLNGSAQATQPGTASGSGGGTASGKPSAPGPQTNSERWLNGLNALRRQMNTALPAGTVTPGSLRQTAATLRRCTPELAALGPPARVLRPTYRLAEQACAAFKQAASFAIAAARAYTTTSPSSSAGRKLSKLFNQTDAAVNRGINLIYGAYYGAPPQAT